MNNLNSSLSQHLSHYGIEQIHPEYYWLMVQADLGRKGVRRLERLRKGAATPAGRRAFYDYIADPRISGIVHSQKEDAIVQSGLAVAQRITGRRRVLDLGCHVGYLTTWYAEIARDRTVTGVDESAEAIRWAQVRAKEINILNVRFEVADLDDGIPGHGYDAIVDTQSTYYVETRELAPRLAEALVPDGIFVSVTPLTTVDLQQRFVDDMTRANLKLRELGYVFHETVDGPGAYPVFVFAGSGPTVKVDFNGLLGSVEMRLQALHGQFEAWMKGNNPIQWTT